MRSESVLFCLQTRSRPTLSSQPLHTSLTSFFLFSSAPKISIPQLSSLSKLSLVDLKNLSSWLPYLQLSSLFLGHVNPNLQPHPPQNNSSTFLNASTFLNSLVIYYTSSYNYAINMPQSSPADFTKNVFPKHYLPHITINKA